MAALLILFPSVSYAFESYPLFYENTRSKGMGGATVALSDDEQALYSNPAALAIRKRKNYAFVSLTGEINQDFRRVKDETDRLSDKDTPEGRAFNNDVLNRTMGTQARLLLSNFAYYLGASGFGVGFLSQSLGEISVIRPTNPRVKNLQVFDSVLSGSFSRPVSGKSIVLSDKSNGWWGFTAKVVTRNYINHDFDARDFAGLSENALKANKFNGVTGDIDFGTFWALDNKYWQTLGLTVGNIFENNLDDNVGHLNRWLAFGTSIHPLSGPQERQEKLLFAADYWSMDEGGSFLSNIRIGLEGKPYDWLALRMGVRGGYISAGLTTTFRLLQLDYATYSEELGPRPGSLEDRRHTVSISAVF